MGLKDIYELVEDAEQVQGYLLADSHRYGELIDSYHHTEDRECELDGRGAVSKERLLDETEHLVDVLEGHEDIIHGLENARDELDNCSGHQIIDGRKVENDSLYNRIEDLLDRYSEDIAETWRICGRAAKDPSLPDPMVMKSRRNLDQEPENSIEELMKTF